MTYKVFGGTLSLTQSISTAYSTKIPFRLCIHSFCSQRQISTGPLAQRLTFCQEQEQNSVNVASSTPVQPPGTLFRQTFMTLLIRVHSENDSKIYFLIVLTTDYCWRSWTSRTAAPYKSRVDWLIDSHCRERISNVYRNVLYCKDIPLAVFCIYDIFQRYDTRLVGRAVTKTLQRDRAARIPSSTLSSTAANGNIMLLFYTNATDSLLSDRWWWG